MTRCRGWQRWFVAVVATLMIAAGCGPRGAAAAEPGVAAVFAVDRQGRLHRLDPVTLADVATVFDHRFRPVDPADPNLFWFAAADGATLVRTHSELPLAHATGANQALPTIVATIIDLPGERLQARFRLRGLHGVAGGQLSADGQRLVLYDTGPAPAAPVGARQATWRVYDTATGDRLTTIKTDTAYPGASSRWTVNPAVHRLYRLTRQGATTAVVAHDLTSGKRSGRQSLHRLGGRGAERVLLDGIAVEAQAPPALVLSPDGRDLVVIQADGLALTRLDARSLVVETRLELEPLVATLATTPASPLSAGPLPTGTSDGDPEFEWHPVFAADGRHLFLTGQVTVSPTDPTDRSVPLQRVNLETGAVEAQGQAFSFVVVAVAPDGATLYVYRANLVRAATGRVVAHDGRIERLDAVTLAPLAPPRTGLYPPLVLVPAEEPIVG